MNDEMLLDFARRYTAAWCSQDAASVASFFATDGSLAVNESAPAVGRVWVTSVASAIEVGLSISAMPR